MNKLVTQSAEKFEDYVNTNGPLIGFDLGTKTIGVAVSDISRKSRTKIIDKIAACYILQGFLDRLKNS